MESFKMETSMAKAFWSFQRAITTKDNFLMVLLMEKEFSTRMKLLFMKDNFKKISIMERARKFPHNQEISTDSRANIEMGKESKGRWAGQTPMAKISSTKALSMKTISLKEWELYNLILERIKANLKMA